MKTVLPVTSASQLSGVSSMADAVAARPKRAVERENFIVNKVRAEQQQDKHQKVQSIPKVLLCRFERTKWIRLVLRLRSLP